MIIWQDLVLAIGGMVGLYSKMYAAVDTDTVVSRKSSVPNAIFFVPSVLAFASLGLWVTALTASVSCLSWFSIAIWRAPESERELSR